MSNWLQQICEDCWYDENPDKSPIKVKNSVKGICCICGKITDGGIFIHVNPATVAYPTLEENDIL